MTTAKIQIFHGQNGQPKIIPQNLTTKIHILTMAMDEIQIFYGQNGKPSGFNLTTKFDHKITILTIDHGADSRMSVAMVKFFDH